MAETNQTEERRGPGRPRVPAVVQRDEEVFNHLQSNGPTQVRDIVDKTAHGRNAVYLSLWRLRNAGRVTYRRDGASRLWQVA